MVESSPPTDGPGRRWRSDPHYGTTDLFKQGDCSERATSSCNLTEHTTCHTAAMDPRATITCASSRVCVCVCSARHWTQCKTSSQPNTNSWVMVQEVLQPSSHQIVLQITIETEDDNKTWVICGTYHRFLHHYIGIEVMSVTAGYVQENCFGLTVMK